MSTYLNELYQKLDQIRAEISITDIHSEDYDELCIEEQNVIDLIEYEVVQNSVGGVL